jgi:hypothetical protein
MLAVEAAVAVLAVLAVAALEALPSVFPQIYLTLVSSSYGLGWKPDHWRRRLLRRCGDGPRK